MRGIRDTQCGFKLFTREAAYELFSRSRINGFCFDVEVLFLARKAGLGIIEVPITWINSPDSRVRLFVDSFLMLMDLLRIRINDIFGMYVHKQPL
jgi:dolichyl-phosphate beta-glucosyltransferase